MKIKGSRILITGGAGFIGSHIAEDLLNKGAEISIYDNLSSGNKINIKNIINDVTFIRGDILDIDNLKDACKDIDIVSHHAAQLEIFKGINHPEKDLQINTIGTLNVLRACVEKKVDKLINASSACVYGQPKSTIQSENHPTNPNWEYGVSKLAAEKYCSIYHTNFGLPVVSLRYGIVYGPREWYRRVLTIYIKRVLSHLPPVIFGDGLAMRDFIFVKDIVTLHNLCVESDMTCGQVYNGGSGKGTTVKELAQLVLDIFGSDIMPITESVSQGEFSKFIPDKRRNIAELSSMILDTTKAHQELGWQPKISIREGIREEINWAAENLSRWGRIYSTEW
jgi:UDP-glucose 4-epimerase